jgi:hypothetical protein
MPVIEDNHDNKLLAQVVPVVLAEWSRVRAWHGEKVIIAVRTSRVPDGSVVEVKILTKSDGTEVDTIGGLKIAGSKVDHEYEIKWKDKPVSAENHEFVLKATVADPAVESELSPALFVDLEPPVLSF